MTISCSGANRPLFTSNPFILSNPAAKTAASYNIPNASTTDLYTCPAGKKALVCSYRIYNYHGSSTASTQIMAYVAGSYRGLRSSAATGASAGSGAIVNLVLTEGQKFALKNTSSFSGSISMWAKIIEFDDGSPLSTSYVTSLSSGANTLYTCPAGKSAMVTSMSNLFSQGITTVGSLSVYNESGFSLTLTAFLANSGDAATLNTNKLFPANKSITNATNSIVVVPEFLNSGDYIVLNANGASANTFCYVTYYEVLNYLP